jgi:hypothetical protein
VNLEAPLKGWEHYDCVAKYVRRPGQPSAATARPGARPAVDAIEDRLGGD